MMRIKEGVPEPQRNMAVVGVIVYLYRHKSLKQVREDL